MGFDWNKYMGFDKLGLNYSIKMDGIEGECFSYSIYFTGDATDEKLEETRKAVGQFEDSLSGEDDYAGYISVAKSGNKIEIYHDIGNVKNENEAIHGVLKSLNNVSDIKNVIVNEGMGGFDDFEDFDDFEHDIEAIED